MQVGVLQRPPRIVRRSSVTRLVALLYEAVGRRRIACEERRQVSSACCTAYSLEGHSDELGLASGAGTLHTELRYL